jgi:hypothetical protein
VRCEVRVVSGNAITSKHPKELSYGGGESWPTQPQGPTLTRALLTEFAHYKSHVEDYTSHVTRHTPHATRHTPHATRHTPHATRHLSAPII